MAAVIKIIKNYIAVILFCVLLLGCSSDNTLSTNQDDSLPVNWTSQNNTKSEELRPYINRFVDEMKQRGITFPINRLSAELVQSLTYQANSYFCGFGYVNFDNTGDPRIEIINSKHCWGRWNETEKENLVFHELGHALLSLKHNNNTMPNGSRRSLMCGGNGGCNNYRIYNKFQNEQRSYYLDQLANNAIAVPNWASKKAFSRTLNEDSFDNGLEGWTTEIYEHADLTQDSENEVHYDFYIDDESLYSTLNAIAIKTISTSSTTKFAYWQKTVPISDFEKCSNVIVRADIVTSHLSEGTAGIIIQLLQKNSKDEFDSFANYTYYIPEYSSGIIISENFEAHNICLPKETDAIRVLLYLYDGRENQVESATATFDNLEIELYE